jgi:hypothetical protein
MIHVTTGHMVVGETITMDDLVSVYQGGANAVFSLPYASRPRSLADFPRLPFVLAMWVPRVVSQFPRPPCRAPWSGVKGMPSSFLCIPCKDVRTAPKAERSISTS